MNRILLPTFVLCFAFLTGCRHPDAVTPMTFTDRTATLRMIACSRGCEQYVLVTDSTDGILISVTNMPDSLKVRALPTAYSNNELPVIFSGTHTYELTDITVPDANDGSKPAFQAYKLTITTLRRR